METRKIMAILVLALGVIVCSAKVSKAQPEEPMGDIFTYQGHLYDANHVADGEYDFQFKLYLNYFGEPHQIGDDVNRPDVDVIDGYFTVVLDFNSPIAFSGFKRFLEIGVRPGDMNDPNVYEVLEPRQEVTPTPYAIYAAASAADSDWMVSGNDMYSIPSGNVGIGTTNPAAKLTVNGAILRDGSTMYGTQAHTHINLGVESTTGKSGENYFFCTVGGGNSNEASGIGATVGGGELNVASYWYATVGGGNDNDANDFAATVGGGSSNEASESGATVGGGAENTASGYVSTVGGGVDNTASEAWATVPGGRENVAGGEYSFAAGRRAKASHDGTFVWGDKTNANFASTANDQFLIRATGGVGIDTNSPQNKLDVEGSVAIGATYSGTESAPWNGLIVQGNVGIGTTNPEFKLTVGSDGGIIAKGSYGSGADPTGGAGTRLIWYPKKAAFRAGCVFANEWDTANIGNYSVAMGYNNTASGYASTVGGGRSNTASDYYATVGGGNDNDANDFAATVGGGFNNEASNDSATVGGGWNNTADANYATVGGGYYNTASGKKATVGGGGGNTASAGGATVGGGSQNTADANLATVGGGFNNEGSGFASTVGGGLNNTADYAGTVPGGQDNTAGGSYSFAAGYRAKANHRGAFVWADSTAADFASTAYDQFLIRASGGVGIGVTDPSEDLDVAGTARLRGISAQAGATYVHVDGNGKLYKITSSKKYKTNIRNLNSDPTAVLELRPVKYQCRISGKEDVGLIAEEVEQVTRDLVIHNDDGSPEAVKYDRVALYLLQVVKAQQGRMAALEERLEALESSSQQSQFSGAKEVQQ